MPLSPSGQSRPSDDAVPAPDLVQVAALTRLLYDPGDLFCLLTFKDGEKDKKKKAPRETWFRMSDSVVDELRPVLVSENNLQPRAAALTVCAFDGGQRREAKNAATIAAFAIDLDGQNLEKVAPGAQRPEDAVPAVLALLDRHGLRPHAVVVSGHGLHLYFAIERVHLVTPEVRDTVKQTWKKLGIVVGGATHRHDLSSVMRCWGTTNWKDGQPGIPVRLLVEHSALDRPRYRLPEMALAVAGVVTPRATKSKKSAAVPRVPQVVNLDPWAAHVLDAMVKLDPKLARARACSRGEVKVEDRSAADHAYARLLLECGWPTEVVAVEIQRSAKGQERGESWVLSTVQAAASAGPQPLTTGGVRGFRPFDDVWKAAYTVLEAPTSSCGASSPPILAVVVGRPGSKKTRGTTSFFARALGNEFGRVGVMTAFIGEALRIEHAINSLYPFGYEATINDERVVFDPDLPKTAVQVWDDGTVVGGLVARLPAEVREFRQRDGRGPWTPEALAVRPDLDVASVFVNAYQPRHFDERLEWPEDHDGNPVRPFWASSDTDDALFQPQAVVKFRATSKLCLAGRNQKDLERPGACQGCEFKSCRSNPEPGASRTYWTKAAVPLLTHGAYRAHLLFRPDLNTFDALVCDEVPDLVYRTPKLRVFARVTSSERASWEVEPVDRLLRLVDRALVVPGPEVVAVADKLRDRRDLLVKQASKLRAEVMAEDRSAFENRVDDLAPLLSSKEFAAFVGHVGRASQADLAPEGVPQEVNDALDELRDFCGDTPLPVLAQQEFGRGGDGEMKLVRPVNGFPDLVNAPDGQQRPLLLLDATAGLDPRYLLAGGLDEEPLPAAEFPNTTVVLTSTSTVTKTKMNKLAPEQVVLDVADHLRRHRLQAGARVLLVTAKDIEPALVNAIDSLQRTRPDLLPATVLVDHFGNLRGKNQYITCDAVFFTHVYRKPDEFYLGLELLLARFQGYPRQWTSKNAAPWNVRLRAPEILHSSMVCDLYQDLMRIKIRSDPTAKATVFLPTSDPRIVTRILRLMRGATLVLPDGCEIHPEHVVKVAA